MLRLAVGGGLTLKRLGGVVVLLAVLVVAVVGSGAAATPRQVSFLATAKGTVVVTWELNGNLESRRAAGCRVDAVGSGRETFAFSSVRPQQVVAFWDGRAYNLFTEYRKPAALSAKATRSGSLTATLSGPASGLCQPSGTVTAPTSGCGAASGKSYMPYNGSVIFANGKIGGRAGAYVSLADLGEWGSQYRLWPWLKRLDPCPSSYMASTPEHLGGGAWRQGRTVIGWGGGGVAYEKSGEWRPQLPSHFWTRRAFNVSTTYTRAYRALNQDVHQVGKETQTVSWTITFRRKS